MGELCPAILGGQGRGYDPRLFRQMSGRLGSRPPMPAKGYNAAVARPDLGYVNRGCDGRLRAWPNELRAIVGDRRNNAADGTDVSGSTPASTD